MKNIIFITLLLITTACSSVDKNDKSVNLIKEQYSALTEKNKFIRYCHNNLSLCQQFFNGKENAYHLNAIK
jgi:hypothetical protein